MEDLKTLLANELPDIKEAIANGVAYGSDLFVRFIQYSIALNIIGLVFAVALIVLSVFVWKFFKKEHDKNSDNYMYDDEWIMLVVIIDFVLGLIVLFLLLNNSITLIKLFYIPEIYVLDRFL